MQQFMLAALFILSAYLLVLYFIGRNRKLLHSSLLSLSVALLIFNSTEDKVLIQSLSISYGWNFRILNLSVILLVYVMIRAWLDQPASLRCTRATAALRIACSAGVFLTFLLPVPSQIALRNGIIGLSALPVLLVMFSVARTALRGIMSNLLLALAALALLNHFAWWTYDYAKGMKLVFYPFDLILAIMMLSTVWFSRYMALFREQQAFAAKLQETDRKRDEFLANTSHELRNPLHGILNLSQVVLERERHALSERSTRELGTMLSIGRQMSMMVDELLDFTRLKDSRIRLNLRPVSLHPIANGVLDMVRNSAETVLLADEFQLVQSYLYIEQVRYGDLLRIHWEAGDPGELRIPPYTLQPLAENAIRHGIMKRSGGGNLWVRLARTDAGAELSVVDDGIGMPEEVVRQFTEQQPASTHGLGIGLRNVDYRLRRVFGAGLRIESAPGKGTKISFIICPL